MKAQKLRGREEIISALIASIFVLATLLISAPLAQAVPITIEISGEVTSASGSALHGTIYEGVTFTGTYTYDTSTPNTSGVDFSGKYVHDAPYGITLSLGGYEFKTTSDHIGQFKVTIVNAVVNDDTYGIISTENTLVNGATVEYIFWELSRPGSTITPIVLPIKAPILTDWDYNVLGIYGTGDLGDLYIKGTVTQAVPEPLTGILMVMGVLFFRRRRKTIKAQKPRGRKEYLSDRFVTFLVFTTLLLPAPLAQAVPITIEISGEVTSASGTGLPDTIYAGVTFTGTYTYDSATPNTSDFGNIGRYVHNSPYGIEVLIGGFEFMTELNHIGQFEVAITDGGSNYDWYRIISNENAPVDGITVESISWELGGPPSTISSIALPTSAPEITDWTINVLEISGPNLFIQGKVTQAVPEPFTCVLMVMGVLFFRRRR